MKANPRKRSRDPMLEYEEDVEGHRNNRTQFPRILPPINYNNEDDRPPLSALKVIQLIPTFLSDYHIIIVHDKFKAIHTILLAFDLSPLPSY